MKTILVNAYEHGFYPPKVVNTMAVLLTDLDIENIKAAQDFLKHTDKRFRLSDAALLCLSRGLS